MSSKIASEVKIGVYAIAKNESKFIKQWITSMWNDGQGADKVYVLAPLTLLLNSLKKL